MEKDQRQGVRDDGGQRRRLLRACVYHLIQ
jgi:hypothetical protein